MRCSADLRCIGIECGGTSGYCSWWKQGSCVTDIERTSKMNTHVTCMKINGNIYKQPPNYHYINIIFKPYVP